MTDSPESRAATRRRWITLGEIIALAALAISALGLWNSWKKDDSGQPAPQAETKAATSDLVWDLDKLQYSLGEGPCIDSLRGASAVSAQGGDP